MELRNSSFQPSGDFIPGMNNQTTFEPRINLQANRPQAPQLKYSGDAQYNMTKPNMIQSKSTQSPVYNLRK